MSAIDNLIPAIEAAISGARIRPLEAPLPADDCGLWFVTHANSDVEVQVESHDGNFPFLIENSRNDARVTTTDIEESIATLRWSLGRYQDQNSSAA